MVQREKEERTEAHSRVLVNLQKMQEEVTSMIVQEKKEVTYGIS